ncbi:unnamed protein product [Auanema sp. JU1783]|nr:unnamed protein product [Auanema sp. JU1783]
MTRAHFYGNIGFLAIFCLMSNRNIKFFRVGLPFFTIIFGGAYGLHYFQQVRFDFRRIKQEDNNLNSLKTDLSQGGLNLKEDVSVDTVYKEISTIDTDNWSNIRGPREFEDNSEYLTAKANQQSRSLQEKEEKKRSLNE